MSVEQAQQLDESAGTVAAGAAGGSRSRYEPALDGMRALFVLAVIAYHYGYGWARGGFLGVDAFFVLSGFLITRLLLTEWRDHGSIRMPRFWGRRVRRLLPASVLVLLFVAVYTATAASPVARHSVRNDGLASIFYVANWRFMLSGQSYFELFGSPSPLRHVWSLAIEEQFYFVWPLVVIACLWLGRGSRRVLAAVCTGGIVASVLAMAVMYDAKDPSRAYYGTDTRAHTLLIGCLLALLLFEHRPTARTALRWAGLFATAAMVLAWHEVNATGSSFYRGGSATYAMAVAVAIASVLIAGPLRRALSVGPVVWIGRISYGLYLWHWPLNIWLIESRVGVGGNALNLVRLAATFAAATVSFYLLEQPIRRGQLSRRVRWWAAPVGIAVTTVAILASAVGAKQQPSYYGVPFGVPARCGPDASEMRNAQDAYRRLNLPTTKRTNSNQRVLLIGDSTACSLSSGLREVGEATGARVEQSAITGCGVVSDEVVSLRGEPMMGGTEHCHGMVDQVLTDSLARVRPTVVIWMSIWEKSDLRVNGRSLRFGSPAANMVIVSRMDAAASRLTRNGAHLVVVTEAPHAPGTAMGTRQVSSAADDAELVRLNELLVKFAARHPTTVTVVDLARKVCPRGPPCSADVEGFRPRPDGTHFSPRGAVWAARWLLPQALPAAG